MKIKKGEKAAARKSGGPPRVHRAMQDLRRMAKPDYTPLYLIGGIAAILVYGRWKKAQTNPG